MEALGITLPEFVQATRTLFIVAFGLVCVVIAFYVARVIATQFKHDGSFWGHMDAYVLALGVFIGILAISPLIVALNIVSIVLHFTGVSPMDDEEEQEFRY